MPWDHVMVTLSRRYSSWFLELPHADHTWIRSLETSKQVQTNIFVRVVFNRANQVWKMWNFYWIPLCVISFCRGRNVCCYLASILLVETSLLYSYHREIIQVLTLTEFSFLTFEICSLVSRFDKHVYNFKNDSAEDSRSAITAPPH